MRRIAALALAVSLAGPVAQAAQEPLTITRVEIDLALDQMTISGTFGVEARR